MTKTPAEQVVKALMAKRRVWRERAAHQFSNGDFVQTLLQYNRSARFSPAALMSDEGDQGKALLTGAKQTKKPAKCSRIRVKKVEKK